MRILLSGALAQRPNRGGHAWVFLNYILGLRRLGHDVRFIDRLADGPRDSDGWNYLRSTMESRGLAGIYGLQITSTGEYLGIDERELLKWTSDCDLLLNFNGFLEDPKLLRLPRRRVYVDIDPGFAQAWWLDGLHDAFAGHESFVTVGLRVGRGSLIPECGRRWITTLPPVVLSEWQAPSEGGSSFTTVGSWRGRFGPVDLQGMTLGHRVHEFRRVYTLPTRVEAQFEVALDIDPAETNDLAKLHENGWRLVDPREVAGNPESYQAYIRGSRAEFCVAKQAYVATGSGWFSDRSACYLATGRPVVAQDTGWSEALPSDCGLVGWTTLDNAVTAIESVLADPSRHAAKAAEFARTYLDSDRVLGDLLEQLEAPA